MIKPDEFRKRLVEAETTVGKMYRKEQTDELLASIKTAQEYLESKLSKFYNEFENSKEKTEGKTEEIANKSRNL